MENRVFTLYEFNMILRDALSLTFPENYMITAEISSLRQDTKGHCYLDLVEKEESSIIARIEARIWSSAYKGISLRFQKATGVTLSKGLKVLVKASLNFHERYGLSLFINDIDPSYTLGEMARKRQEVIARLTKEGLIDRNKRLPSPPVPQRIAVISSSRAAGYEDFINHLTNNSYGYTFKVKLFEAIMQGDGAEASIVRALSLCEASYNEFDVVVIVRGGGATSELDCFDSYEIGRKIALMPVPVFSGIGHERDRTVIDETAHTGVKTPTAAAALFIEKLKTFEELLDSCENRVITGAGKIREDRLKDLIMLSGMLETAALSVILKSNFTIRSLLKGLKSALPYLKSHKSRLTGLSEKFRLIALNQIKIEESRMAALSHSVATGTALFLSRQNEMLQSKSATIDHLDPLNILKRGYSITKYNGRVLKSVDGVSVNEIIETELHDGILRSRMID